MSTYPEVTLKPRKEIPLRAGHPWIFSEALSKDLQTEPGEIVLVHSSDGQVLGLGMHNNNTSIRVRMLTRDVKEAIDVDFFVRRFQKLSMWKEAGLPAGTNGYRLVHAETDGLPGLIVDRFNTVFVFQIHTAGMNRLRPLVIEALQKAFAPEAIVERSDVDVRRMEGLNDQPIAVHFGTITKPVQFIEAGLTFEADVLKGQKTGFFLDQREARMTVGRLAKGKRVLNLFAYSGAFTVHAARGGADFVSSVDASHAALELAQSQLRLNGFDPENEKRFTFLEADIFELLQERTIPDGPYDVIVCDPPALAKNAKQIPQALKAYSDLNTLCFSHLQPGGILVTSSCSGRIEPEDFRSMLRIASGRSRRNVRVLDWIAQPIDHAECLSYPEGRYLKTAILQVTDLL